MTRDKYLEMMDQLGKEPVEEEIPPDWEDFPEIVLDALNTFNMLGDRMYPDVGYVGKDYTNLNHFIELFDIQDKLFFMGLYNPSTEVFSCL